MRVLLDACILFPTVMREVLIGTAEAGAFTPLWSPKILAEWRHTAGKLATDGDAIAGVEIALLTANWPQASITVSDVDIDALSLPDENDRHVFAAAIAGQADVLLTKNLRDFPRRTLARHDILLREPDSFLHEIAVEGRIDMAAVARRVQQRAEAASGREPPMRALLKRARLPKLGKLLAA